MRKGDPTTATDKPVVTIAGAPAIQWPSGGGASLVRDDLDARILAVLWVVRKTFPPMFMLGLSVAVTYFIVIRDPEAFSERIGALSEPSELFGALLSPFSVAVLAVAIRIVVALAALVAAYPLTRVNGPDDYPQTNRVGRYWRMWWDRWQMSHAYRAERWTWAVRNVVLDRLGAWGTWWQRWDLLMLVLNVVLVIVFFFLLGVMGSQLPD